MNMQKVMGKTNSKETELYVLKHKDLDVAMIRINAFTGQIDYIVAIYLPEELPPGCDRNGNGLTEWWESRAIPDSRRGIQQVLKQLEEESNLSLMLSSYGLSLTDHYWMQPIGLELYWKDLNFFENVFSDELGNLLTDSEKIDYEGNISKFSPASSVNGEMKKKWVIRDGIRYLLKVNTNDYGQQAVNEKIACRLHERLGWENYIPYSLETIAVEGRIYPCSLNLLFTSIELEFVSGYQLIRGYKVPNDSSNYEAMIQLAVQYGLQESEVRMQMEYTILTDFILSNTDRHFNNFGFLYSQKRHQFVKMAPIFDNGNSLFYDKEVIPSGMNLLEIPVNSFCKREVDMLRYVSHRGLIDTGKLAGFPEEAEQYIRKYTEMSENRIQKIGRTIEQKIEYLKLFQQGKSIWKKEKYW